MKKKTLLAAMISILSISAVTGCTEQSMAKHFGGDMTVHLEKGQKLEEVTWKENSLWYLTRPLKEDEEPETYVFYEDSNLGIFEGSVTIVESK